MGRAAFRAAESQKPGGALGGLSAGRAVVRREVGRWTQGHGEVFVVSATRRRVDGL
jgi:hypothetical protein